jgi:hypothetical protein
MPQNESFTFGREVRAYSKLEQKKMRVI